MYKKTFSVCFGNIVVLTKKICKRWHYHYIVYYSINFCFVKRIHVRLFFQTFILDSSAINNSTKISAIVRPVSARVQYYIGIS